MPDDVAGIGLPEAVPDSLKPLAGAAAKTFEIFGNGAFNYNIVKVEYGLNAGKDAVAGVVKQLSGIETKRDADVKDQGGISAGEILKQTVGGKDAVVKPDIGKGTGGFYR